MFASAKLHVITDTVIQKKFSHLQLAEMAFRAGADVVQYRNKNFIEENDLNELMQISRLSKLYNKTLIINDDVSLAKKINAEGVHLGKEDMPVREARKILGEKFIIGGTAHSLKEALQGKTEGADYLGVGPVFGSTSKSDALSPMGLETLEEIVSAVKIPVIAIGNVSEKNMEDVLQTGVSGVAVISAVCLAENPEYAVRRLCDKLHAFQIK